MPSEEASKFPEIMDESDEETHRRSKLQSRQKHKSRENDVQVLIIPEEESQLPDLRIYQILGHTPRKRV